MNRVGKPTKYTPELLAAAHAGDGWVKAGDQVPTVASLALAIGIRRSTKQDGTGKTGSPDRRLDLPDLIRRTGAGFQARGHRAAAARSPEWVQDRSTSRRAKVFLPLAMPDLLTFFHRRYRANSGATAPAVSPRVSGGHFVSSPGAISFQMTRRKKFLNGCNRLPTAGI